MVSPSPLRHRPAGERFLSRNDWLESWHSFSFAGHDDPSWRSFGPLRVINDDRIAAGRGFGLHPHRDMDIITVMIEGQIDHRDSLGSEGRLLAGDVQAMAAGTGIQHSEINGGDHPCRLLQIWIEPAATGLPPRYAQRSITLGAGWTPLVAPAGSGATTLSLSRPIRLWRAQPKAGQALTLPLQESSLGWIQVINGRLHLKPLGTDDLPTLAAGDGLGFAAAQVQELTAIEGEADLLLFQLT
ncbi:MAG: pirin family protein [Cyanobacteriota bacterium]